MAGKRYDGNAGFADGPATASPAETHFGDEGVGDNANEVWFEHSTGKRIDTDTLMAKSLAQQYPSLQLTIAPTANGVSLLSYAAAGHARCRAIAEKPGAGSSGSGSGSSSSSSSSSGAFSPVALTLYVPPARRIDGDQGALAQKLHFGKFEYRWRGHDFLVYVVNGRDGTQAYAAVTNHYVLSAERGPAEALLLAAGAWANELHGEVWVFDQGYWQKSAELFRSIMGASWDNVILDPAMKRAIIDDHESFFDSRDAYARLKVPWKRGIIYHGPPGNGKTISIKATMHMLYDREDPVPTLYVRSLVSFSGPEYALMAIFNKARQFAPCYLVFEDLDSIVSDQVRSYFLNEVDGLKNNDGIFMVGSTNHLDRLDPGISKRPSRFDRKYFFPDPDLEQRIAYCKFWQRKLADNKDIEFPDELCKSIAEITDKFSFAYMQEAFVAALLAMARRSKGGERRGQESPTQDVGDGWLDVCDSGDDDDHGDLDDLPLWVEIKKQIETLREGMESETRDKELVGTGTPDCL
ncbi:P-loop containing nucleoside triphosphate hydrolase protein [Xylaria castorea]|nr:P-loop containing nucleoside triphosphate hydrolase protein [Xylaria castorea]